MWAATWRKVRNRAGEGKTSDNTRENAKLGGIQMVEAPKTQGCTTGHAELSSTFISITQVGCQTRKTGQFCGYWNDIHFGQGVGKTPTWDACERNGRVRNRRWNNPTCLGEVFKAVPRVHQQPRTAGECASSDPGSTGVSYMLQTQADDPCETGI